uniref:Uncharacterized protein n=1 Tax=Arundo donax TaxID=35708 RepID=A0A0A9BPL9_ARUDO
MASLKLREFCSEIHKVSSMTTLVL